MNKDNNRLRLVTSPQSGEGKVRQSPALACSRIYLTQRPGVLRERSISC